MTYTEGMQLVKYTALASLGFFSLGSDSCVDCSYQTLPYIFAHNLEDNQSVLRAVGFSGLVAILIAAKMLVDNIREKEKQEGEKKK